MSWQQFFRDTIQVSTAFNTFQTTKKIDALNETMNDFRDQSIHSFQEIKNTLNKGFAKLSLELALQSKTFNNILTVLKERRKTEAEELKSFGITAIRNGWIDDAISDFQKSLEFNRYDYQVYFLISKCYFLKENYNEQDVYLKKAFNYSSVDPAFQQYIIFDIVGQLISENCWNDAEEILQRYELQFQIDEISSPLLLSKISLKFYKKIVNEDVLQWISLAIDTYEGKDPSRIVDVIELLSFMLEDQDRSLVFQKLGAKKFVIAKKFGINMMISINNIESSLVFLRNADSDSIISKFN